MQDNNMNQVTNGTEQFNAGNPASYANTPNAVPGYAPNPAQPPEQPKPKKKSAKKIIISVVIAVVALILVGIIAVVGLILTFTVFIPNSKYNKAVKLESEGNYDEAIAIFTELGDYKDAPELIIEAQEHKEEALLRERIEEAQALFDSGKRIDAYKMLLPDIEKDGVAEILEGYKGIIIEETSKSITWNEDDMSDYHWAHSSFEDESFDLDDPYFYIYLSENKDDPSDRTIFLQIYTAEVTDGFVSPVHPETIRLRNNAGEVDITVGFNDRDFETDYPIDWYEDICVEITLDQANTISDMFESGEDVRMRLMGSSRSRDFTLGENEAQGIIDIVEYITVIYALDS